MWLLIKERLGTSDCHITTPNVRGLHIDTAKNLLKERGMTLVLKDTGIYPGLPTSYIIDQAPPPGTINCDSIIVTLNRM